MTRIPLWLMVIIAIVLVLGGRAISAQDKYSREHAPGILEAGDDEALVSDESPPAPSRHAIVPDLSATAPMPDPQGAPAAEQPAETLAVNTPEQHLDASPPNYTALPPVTTAPPSVDVTALPSDAEIISKPVRKPVIQKPVGRPVIQKPATAAPSRKRAQIGILERRRMLREGLMSPGFLPPR